MFKAFHCLASSLGREEFSAQCMCLCPSSTANQYLFLLKHSHYVGVPRPAQKLPFKIKYYFLMFLLYDYAHEMLALFIVVEVSYARFSAFPLVKQKQQQQQLTIQSII